MSTPETPKIACMPPSNRTMVRNVWIEFASAPGVIEGGLCAAKNLTQCEFLEMLNIVFVSNGGFEARLHGSKAPITPTEETLQHGKYILTPLSPGGQVRTSDACFYPRTLSELKFLEDDAFQRQVCHRDRRCVISGLINPDADCNIWCGWRAAHIFPLALNDLFISMGFAQLITHNVPPGANSPQNGILLQSCIHCYWDSYFLAVNPNNGYKVQSFLRGTDRYHGKVLHPVCRQQGDPLSVVDALLRWHYEQAVLCNMRGAGEPVFEFDFPPGTDMMGEIQRGPQAAERMEAELFNRLYGWYDRVRSPID